MQLLQFARDRVCCRPAFYVCTVFFVACVLLVTFHNSHASLYLDSAHGSTTIGVCLDGICDETSGGGHGYARGNCANCHEMHSSMDGSEPAPVDGSASPFALLTTTFNQSATPGAYVTGDGLCFYCHGSTHQLVNTMDNQDYAELFGGYGGGPQTILATFNQYDHSARTGSNHNLEAVQTYAAANFSSFFHSNSDPCSACHNVHLAKDYKNHADEAGYSAISRPVDHFNLWGDETDENMDDADGVYRAPFYVGDASREPGGTAITDGSTTPNYNDYCLDCHGGTTPDITSVNRTGDSYYSTAVLHDIDWTTTGKDISSAGDKHGVNSTDAEDDVATKAPYNGDHSLTLSCMDCHEAHGSEHKALVRRSINGHPVTVDGYSTSDVIGDEDGDRGWQCRQCHKDDYELKAPLYKPENMNKWSKTHHGGGADNPYSSGDIATWTIPENDPTGGGACNCHYVPGSPKLPIKCEYCHYHGSWLSGDTGVTVDVGLATERVIPPPANPAPGSGVYSRKSF